MKKSPAYGRIFLLGDGCTVPTNGSVITTKGSARKTANRLVFLPALAIDIAIRYRYRSCPAFSIASSDIDSDPE
ncbi:MAG: hypothetical protein BECKG1743E_GA0114224_102406, partial [Candidatus Kentron sp. G]